MLHNLDFKGARSPIFWSFIS